MIFKNNEKVEWDMKRIFFGFLSLLWRLIIYTVIFINVYLATEILEDPVGMGLNCFEWHEVWSHVGTIALFIGIIVIITVFKKIILKKKSRWLLEMMILIIIIVTAVLIELNLNIIFYHYIPKLGPNI